MTKYRYAQRKGKYVGKIDKFLNGVRLNDLIRRTVRLCDADRGIEIDNQRRQKRETYKDERNRKGQRRSEMSDVRRSQRKLDAKQKFDARQPYT